MFLTISAVWETAYAGSYGSFTTAPLKDVRKLELKNNNGGKNSTMNFKRRSSKVEATEIPTTTFVVENNLTKIAGYHDLPEIYILVLVSSLYSLFRSVSVPW